MFVRRELVLGGHEMPVPGADIVDVSWHGKAARAFGVNWAVVPFERHAGKAVLKSLYPRVIQRLSKHLLTSYFLTGKSPIHN